VVSVLYTQQIPGARDAPVVQVVVLGVVTGGVRSHRWWCWDIVVISGGDGGGGDVATWSWIGVAGAGGDVGGSTRITCVVGL